MHIIFFHLTRARTLPLVYIIFHCADLFLAARPVPPSSPMKPSLSIQLALALPLANHAGALAPPRAAPPRILEAPSQPVTRREAALSLVATVAAASLVPGAALADSAMDKRMASLGASAAAPDPTEAQRKAADEAAAAEARERMKRRIEESKKNYRKPTDLVKQRKETTDYSCVAETGSPCK